MGCFIDVFMSMGYRQKFLIFKLFEILMKVQLIPKILWFYKTVAVPWSDHLPGFRRACPFRGRCGLQWVVSLACVSLSVKLGCLQGTSPLEGSVPAPAGFPGERVPRGPAVCSLQSYQPFMTPPCPASCLSGGCSLPPCLLHS